MSRGIIILIVVLSVVLGALLFMPRFAGTGTAPAPVVTTVPAVSDSAPPVAPRITAPPVITPQVVRTSATAVAMVKVTNDVTTPEMPDETPQARPLPVLERDYRATTNTDTRLDIIMDIADTPGAESIRTLTRLFQVETDPQLQVDLIDSLLAIEGNKDEKLAMLALGIRQGLPTDVRQSSIDGLIDLEDQRVVALLNGLLNDPDPEIREGAQDALELVQLPPAELPRNKLK